MINELIKEYENELGNLSNDEEKEIVMMCAVLQAVAEYCREKANDFITNSIGKYKRRGVQNYKNNIIFKEECAEQALDRIISIFLEGIPPKYIKSKLTGGVILDFFSDWLDFGNKYLKLIAPYYFAMIIANGVIKKNIFEDTIKEYFLIQNNHNDFDFINFNFKNLTDDVVENISKNQTKYNKNMLKRHFGYSLSNNKKIAGAKDNRTKASRYGKGDSVLNINLLFVFSELLSNMPACIPVLSILLFQNITKLPQLVLGDRIYDLSSHNKITFCRFLDNTPDNQVIEKIKKDLLKDDKRCEKLLELIKENEFNDLSQEIMNIIRPVERIREGKQEEREYYRDLLAICNIEQVFDRSFEFYQPGDIDELLLHPDVEFLDKFVLYKVNNKVKINRGSLYDDYYYPDVTGTSFQSAGSVSFITKPHIIEESD